MSASKRHGGSAPRNNHGRKKKRRRPKPTSPPEERNGGSTRWLGVEAAGRLLVGLIFLASLFAIVKIFIDTPVGVRFVAGVASVLVGWDVFDVINWRRLALLRQKRVRPLIWQYALCLAATIAVAVLGFVAAPHSLEALAVVFAFVLVAFRRARIEDDICKQLTSMGKSTLQPRWGKRVAEWADRLITYHASHTADDDASVMDEVKRLAAKWLRGRPLSPHHDGRRVVTALVIAIALVLALWTGMAWAARGADLAIEGIKEGLALINGSGPRKRAPKPLPADSTAGTRVTVGPARAPILATPNVSSSLTTASLCATPLVTRGSRSVAETITELFAGGPRLGGIEAPGTLIAGCPGKLHVTRTASGLFAYTLGKSPITGETLSIAVDSPLGSGLVLAPAVQPVLALIRQFKVVGAGKRRNVSSGDFIPVQTSAGTFLLIRRETGSALATKAFTVIPPVVAQGWIDAVARSQQFLWPVPRHHSRATVYYFESNSQPSQVAYTFPYRPSGEVEPKLSEAELGAAASLAG
jgi:hypothetical protein